MARQREGDVATFHFIDNMARAIRHVGRIRCPVTVAWAEHEAAEFARQSREFAARLQAPTILGHGMNHFEIIETLADAGAPLGAAALRMLTSVNE